MKQPRKKPKPPDPTFGDRLVKSLLRVFTDAYQLHAGGATETELLIQHDIFAAASNYHQTVIEGHRKAIRSAIAAVDKGVPLDQAVAYLETQLRDRMAEIVKEINDG